MDEKRQVHDLTDDELEAVVVSGVMDGVFLPGKPDLNEVLDEMKLRAMRKGMDMATEFIRKELEEHPLRVLAAWDSIDEKEFEDAQKKVERAKARRQPKTSPLDDAPPVPSVPWSDVMKELETKAVKAQKDRADRFKGVFAATKDKVVEKVVKGERLTGRDQFIADKLAEAESNKLWQ